MTEPALPEDSVHLASSISRLEGLLSQMSRIHAFELAVAEAHQRDELPGLLHLSIGGEGSTVGIISALREDDRIYTSHRAHAHFLAAGSDEGALMAELAGRESGLCRGRAGSMHLMDERVVMASGVVGGTLPIALGHSLNVVDGALVAAFFGDGAVQTGTFHETLNMAALWQAPLLFVCENNGYIEFSSRREHTPVAEVGSYGALYGMTTRTVDGTDVAAVLAIASELVAGIREGRGPALLDCHVTRLRAHYEGDLRVQGSGVDPLARAVDTLVEEGRNRDELHARMQHDLDQARSSLAGMLAHAPRPDPSEDEQLVYERPLR